MNREVYVTTDTNITLNYRFNFPVATKPAEPKPVKKAAAKAPVKKAVAKKPAQAKPGKAKPVTFTYVNPTAEKVHLSGYFLVRTDGYKQMFKNSEGTWEITVYLTSGVTYRYRYQIMDAQGDKKTTGWEDIEVK